METGQRKETDEIKPYKQRTGSVFASWPGLCLLVFFLGLSAYFKADIILIFLFSLFLLSLVGFLWSRSAASGIACQVTVQDPAVFPGEELCVRLDLRNKGRLPLIWAEIYLPLERPGLLDWKNGEPRFVRFPWPDAPGAEKSWEGDAAFQKFTWVRSAGELSCTLCFQAKKRGICRIPALFAQAGDGFGLSVKSTRISGAEDAVLVIYPQIKPIDTGFFFYQGTQYAPDVRGQFEDVTLLKNIRDYQPSDSFKRVNYRLLAKQGKWQVNVYEKQQPKCVAFVLDFASFQYTGDGKTGIYEEPFEQAISLAASCLAALEEKHAATALALPGYAGRDPVLIRNTGGTTEFLLLLADVCYQGGEVFWEEETLRQLPAFYGRPYVICYQTPKIPETLPDFYTIDLSAASQSSLE